MTASASTRRLIREIVDKIRREYRPERIVLFGSYANGNPGPDSDIDLLIVKETSDRPIDRRLEHFDPLRFRNGGIVLREAYP